MPAIQPKILVYRVLALRALIRHGRQTHPIVGIVRAVRVQHFVVLRLRELALVVEHVVEEPVHVDVPEGGALVFRVGGEVGDHGFQPDVEIVHFILFSGAHVPEFGRAV